METEMGDMELIEYRDRGMNTYTYFWFNEKKKRVLSPYFNTITEAKNWKEEHDKKNRKQTNE
jgi:hypothetical protein